MIGESDYETPVRVQLIVKDNAFGYVDISVGIPPEEVDFDSDVSPEAQARGFLEEQEPDVEIVDVETVA